MTIRSCCIACDRTVGHRNKSGYCRDCYPEFQADYQREHKAANRLRAVIKPQPPRHAEKGLLKRDNEYREQMELANRRFLARLIMAMPA